MRPTAFAAALAALIVPTSPAPPGTAYRLLVPNAHYGGLLEYLRGSWPGEVAAVTSSQQAFSYLTDQGCYTVLGSPREVHVPDGSASALLVEYEETLLQAAGRDKAILTRFLPALAAGGPLILHTSRPRLARLAGHLAAALTDLRAWSGGAGDVYVLGRAGPAAAEDRPATAKALRAFAQSEEPRFGPDTPLPAVPVPRGPFRTRGGFMPAVLLAEAAEHGVFAERYRRELFFPAWQRRLVTLMPPRHGHLALLVAGGSLDGAVITTPAGERLLLKGLVRKRRERAEDEEGRRVETEAFESEVNAVDLDTGRYLVML